MLIRFELKVQRASNHIILINALELGTPREHSTTCGSV
jgi:hypothetical protein